MAFAIGIDHPKSEVNIGTLWRSAFCFGASLIFTVGRRYERQASDTTQSWRHLPLMHFSTWDEYQQHAPFGWIPIGIEIGRSAIDLRLFSHPRSAVYILGAEDHGLTNESVTLCHQLVVIPTRYCLNVAVAGSIIMYDRHLKRKP